MNHYKIHTHLIINNMKVKFSIIGRKWKSISIYGIRKKTYIIRFWNKYPFFDIITLHFK